MDRRGLATFDELAGFLEHDGGLLRAEAEVLAFEHCIAEWLNANPISSPAERCAWCGKAETPSATVLPFGAGEHHAWVHAECWPAWHQLRWAEATAALRTDASITIPLDAAGRPDLQALVEPAGRRHAASIVEGYDPNPFTRPPHQGGYQHITAEEWAAWGRAKAEWQERRRAGLARA